MVINVRYANKTVTYGPFYVCDHEILHNSLNI